MPHSWAPSKNPLYGQYQDLVSFARIIEREFNDDSRPNRAVSRSATIYGMGVKNGYSVTLPNEGGQWQNSFRPYLDIEVVSDDAEQTTAMLSDVVNDVLDLVSSSQREVGVSASNLIRAELAPSQPELVLVSSNRPRSLLSLVLLAVLTFAMSSGARKTRTIPKSQE
jgi:hypothetical protein